MPAISRTSCVFGRPVTTSRIHQADTPAALQPSTEMATSSDTNTWRHDRMSAAALSANCMSVDPTDAPQCLCHEKYTHCYSAGWEKQAVDELSRVGGCKKNRRDCVRR